MTSTLRKIGSCLQWFPIVNTLCHTCWWSVSQVYMIVWSIWKKHFVFHRKKKILIEWKQGLPSLSYDCACKSIEVVSYKGDSMKPTQKAIQVALIYCTSFHCSELTYTFREMICDKGNTNLMIYMKNNFSCAHLKFNVSMQMFKK